MLPALKHPAARRILPAIAAGALLVGLTPGAAHAAVTERTVTLPLLTVGDVVAGDDNVFVSGGVKGTTIVATNRSGGNIRTIGDLNEPTDLQLSADGATLYVALRTEIRAIDTTTLATTARYATGVVCPRSLALTGSSLWFGYGCDQWGGNIGRVDLAANPPAVTTGLAPEQFYAHPLLSAGAGNSGVLFAGQPSLSPGAVSVLAIGADSKLRLAGKTEHTAVGSFLDDLAAAPGADSFYTASGAPYAILQFTTTDLRAASRQVTIGPYPNAVELSADGSQIAAANRTGVYVFGTANAPAIPLRLSGRDPVAAGGLAWAPDGTRLFAATADDGVTPTDPAVLHIYTASIVTAKLVA